MSNQSTANANIDLPKPSPEALELSLQLTQKIQAAIKQNNGHLSFKDYMQMALYYPGLGYYSAGMQKFGRSGDFITAPEISPLFSQVIAIQCQLLFKSLNSPIILEAGAGSGRLAIELIKELATRDSLPEHYYIMEVSADLKERQQHLIKQEIPELYNRFKWLEALPEQGFDGVVIGNEVLDAMPVHLINLNSNNELFERHVTSQDDSFEWLDLPCENPQLLGYKDTIGQLLQQFSHLKDSHGDYISEVNLLAQQWIQTMAKHLNKGAMILVDYGYPEREYFHPQRHMGTLMCHYQHHRHDDPFYLPGLQDITAHVNFSDIANAAVKAKLQVAGFTTQAHFLLAGGLMELSQCIDPEDINNYVKMAQEIKTLTLPDEMGELFKVILLSKGLETSLDAFKMQDMRERL